MLRPFILVRIASAKLAFVAGLGLAPALGAIVELPVQHSQAVIQHIERIWPGPGAF